MLDPRLAPATGAIPGLKKGNRHIRQACVPMPERMQTWHPPMGLGATMC